MLLESLVALTKPIGSELVLVAALVIPYLIVPVSKIVGKLGFFKVTTVGYDNRVQHSRNTKERSQISDRNSI